MKRFSIIVSLLLVLLLTSCTNGASSTSSAATSLESGSQSSQTSGTTAALSYRIPERIRWAFRPEWTWNDKRGDYDDIGDLKRDPATGLFPEPVMKTNEDRRDQTWDPHLGLFIINWMHIDYENDAFYSDPVPTPTYYGQEPHYNRNELDKFNLAYNIYSVFVIARYPVNGPSSGIPYIDMGVFKKYKLTPAWFGMSLLDLPMIISKLEAGAPPAFAMSLIMLFTHADIGIRPSAGATDRYIKWVDTFNTMKSQITDRLAQGDIVSVGYLALPVIRDVLANGQTYYLALLPDITDGIDGCAKAITASWDKAQWISWFSEHTNEMSSLRWVINHQINMPWLK